MNNVLNGMFVRPIRTAIRSLSDMLEWPSIRKSFTGRYGRDLVFTIDRRDEMYSFLQQHAAHPARGYFSSGESMLSDLGEVLRDAGRPYGQVKSLLEFANGYGRFTRFLVHRVDPASITVSDIDASAVDFTTQTFGVRGFYSVSEAEALSCGDRYDIIFVASLFSHLSLIFWESWLQRLFELLESRGLLIFSTHGLHALRLLGDEPKGRLDQMSPGFWFLKSNETHGRLSTDYYGTTYVSDDYVRAFISSHHLGEMLAFYPAKLWKFQDIYVVQRQ